MIRHARQRDLAAGDRVQPDRQAFRRSPLRGYQPKGGKRIASFALTFTYWA